ncbi:protein OCTOPUS-like [Diospyros lotus]|uniref:protein OCTOPUS-like n=1 Tax=Diospyros lotus TaxID=55363 RepID=UPI002252F8FF|nr:protein OCTOPUS-like [Diospyros lotus]
MTHRELQSKPRRLSICHRHPAEPVTGFCASCLRERLAGLDSPAHPEVSSSITAPEAVIIGFGGGDDGAGARSGANDAPRQELRRCKSYAAGKCRAYAGASEPRRKSCDARARSTLGHLFDVDDEEKGLGRGIEVESKNLGFSGVTRSVAEIRDKIRVSEDVSGANGNVSQPRDEEFEEDVKTMKEHIELEWQSRRHKVRDFKHIAESFWGAASVFSQKLRKLKLKQRMRKPSDCGESRSGGGDLTPGNKQNGRQFRETQSEVGDYGYGRRSCDTDPRFSVDAARMSLDDPRFSFDEPRASWDGYMIARTIPRLAPMLSVIENAMMPLPLMNRAGYGVGVSIEEQMNPINEDETTSGGSAQTRDYCSDSSSSQRQNSFDCSSSGKSSNKKTVTLEVDKMKSLSDYKVSNMESAVANTDTRDIDFGSVKYDHSGRFESAGKDAISVAGGGIQDGGKKLGKWRKAWNILGFMHRFHDIKYEVPEGNAIGYPLGDCLEKQNGDADVAADGSSSGKFVRIGSCSSSSYKMNGSFHRSSSVAESRSYAVKSREEPALEQNRSARYSPSHFDNGLLRFHLTPSWTSRRKSGRSRRKNSHSSAKSVLRMS